MPGRPGRPARRRRYGSFPTTADVGVWASGTTVSDLFDGLGLGLYALITDLRKVRPTEERTVSASSTDPKELIVAFLSELILLADTEGFVGRQVHARVLGSPPTAVLASVQGERFDPARHARRKDVKAVTLHGLTVDLDHPHARVIVDI